MSVTHNLIAIVTWYRLRVGQYDIDTDIVISQDTIHSDYTSLILKQLIWCLNLKYFQCKFFVSIFVIYFSRQKKCKDAYLYVTEM